MRKLLSILLVAVIAFSVSGCTKYKTSSELPQIGSEDEFRFAAYMTPPQANVGSDILKNNPNYITDEQYKWIAECGFNYAYAVYEFEIEDIITVLDLCEKYGIKYMARDNGKGASFGSLIASGTNIENITDEQKSEIKARVDLYKDHPAFAGHIIYDEPSAALFDNIAKVKEFYEEYLPDKEYFVNLLPDTSAGQLGAETYNDYLEQFLQKVQPEMLSYDRYPLTYDTSGNPDLGIGYIANFEKAAVKAKEYNIPFYMFILTMGHWNYRTPKNYDDLAWQVYNSMAYGAKGIETFTYWTTMGTGENITYGLIDWYGNRTQTWYSMQQLISEIKAFESVYMDFDWQNTVCYTADSDYQNYQFEGLNSSVLAYDNAENPIDGISSIKGDGDALLGYFTNADGYKGYMLTNMADPADDETITIELKFNDAKEVIVYKKGRMVRYALNKGVLTTKLGSGEGQFIIPL